MNTELRNHHKHAIHQTILECCADLLDEDDIVRHQLMLGIEDPISREESELHIRMADAAYAEYEKTMFPDEIQSCGLLPSEILKQRDELRRMLENIYQIEDAAFGLKSFNVEDLKRKIKRVLESTEGKAV